jgi:hypothetical protein
MENWMWLVFGLIGIGLLPTFWLLDRLGLWLEDRGWLFYRNKKPSSSPLSALVAMQQFIEPGVQHVAHAGRERRVEDGRSAPRDRLLACLRKSLTTMPVNPEVIRLYLTQAKREDLDWQKLYAESALGLPEDLAPPLEDVAPVD